MFTQNTFIKWTSKDMEGTFSEIGKVISHSDGMITFSNQYGSISGIPEDEGKFTKTTKPKSWSDVKAPPKVVAKPVEKKERVKRVNNGPTKLDSVIELFKDNKPSSRKEAIQAIVDSGLMSAAGASTYWNKAKDMI